VENVDNPHTTGSQKLLGKFDDSNSGALLKKQNAAKIRAQTRAKSPRQVKRFQEVNRKQGRALPLEFIFEKLCNFLAAQERSSGRKRV